MSTTEIPTPRLKERYDSEVRDALKERFGLDTVMAVPRLQKITLNMGVGEAKLNSKALDDAVEELAIIAGQRPLDHARQELDRRLQDPRGHAHRLQGDAARRPHVRVPRPADDDRAARGSATSAGSTRAPSTAAATSRWASASRSSSPRSTTTTCPQVRGLNVTITTTATDDEGARELLRALGMPFAAD